MYTYKVLKCIISRQCWTQFTKSVLNACGITCLLPISLPQKSFTDNLLNDFHLLWHNGYVLKCKESKVLQSFSILLCVSAMYFGQIPCVHTSCTYTCIYIYISIYTVAVEFSRFRCCFPFTDFLQILSANCCFCSELDKIDCLKFTLDFFFVNDY